MIILIKQNESQLPLPPLLVTTKLCKQHKNSTNNEFNTNGRLVDIKSFINKLELPTLRRMRGKYI